jgi:hypothetical protein
MSSVLFCNLNSNELNVFIKLFVILYADDTVILADTKEGMQNALIIFQSYGEI